MGQVKSGPDIDSYFIKDEVGAELRVVGWYHSHPHITVLPSRVDLSTQVYYFISVILYNTSLR